jgi:crotonobetainyl-CoA:carnitine CoA-transferase CaiB-like acyl-CoA transferase
LTACAYLEPRPHFQKHSRNKKSLDLDQPSGKKVFLDLVRQSDVFVENNSPRVLPNFGLDWDALRAVNPNLVMCPMPGFGNSGPLRDWLGFGINLEAYCGLSSVTGYEDTGPVRSVIPYGDPRPAGGGSHRGRFALRQAHRRGPAY